jgi:predicted acyltransferase
MKPDAASSPRVESIDVFRGLTMFLMLFVNDLNDADLGNISNLPDWLRHMPAGRDGMTFVDVIFPAFLFSAGLSIPLALRRRLDAGAAASALFAHIAGRSFSLVLIGLGMVNTYRFHPTAMLIPPAWWELLFFLAVILVWNRETVSTVWTRLRRFGGILLLVLLAWLYRGSDGGDATWMRTSWWGILTMIGFAYFVTATAFVFARDRSLVFVALLAFLTALNIAGLTGALASLNPLHPLFPAGTLLGALPSITVAGAIAGLILESTSGRIRRLLVLAALLTIAGVLLREPWGVSKHASTPAWCLLCAGICCALYAGVHWLVDVKGCSRWANFARPAGRQPLLAYILPHIFYSLLAVLGITWFGESLTSGWPGALRSLALAGFFVWVTRELTRRHVILQL